MTTPPTAREIVERLPMFVVACSHCPKPLSHDYGYAEKANLALAIVTQALDAAVRVERERCIAAICARCRAGVPIEPAAECERMGHAYAWAPPPICHVYAKDRFGGAHIHCDAAALRAPEAGERDA